MFSDNAPKLNNAYVAFKLSKIMPRMAQLERSKECCDESEDQLGYYGTFKKFAASRRESMVDLILFILPAFWDDVIRMVEQIELCMISAAIPFVLMCPISIGSLPSHWTSLAITIVVCTGRGGHYIKHGKHRRFQIFDRWWNRMIAAAVQEPQQINNRKSNSSYASLTQDSLFWARVEEAKDWLEKAEDEKDPIKLELLLKNLTGFEKQAKELDAKELSIDVLAKRSSYTWWAEKWKAFQSKFPQQPSAPALNGMDSD